MARALRARATAALGAAAMVATVVAGTPAAQATHPGENGKLACWSARTGSFEILTLNPDGSGQTIVTSSGSGMSVDPVWTPDGRHLVFASNRNTLWELYKSNPDGSNVQPFNHNGTIDDRPRTFSSDGNRLVVQRNNFGLGTGFDVLVMNSDGTNVVNLTPEPGTDGLPDWQPVPNGRIAYNSARITGDFDIWTMNPDGSDKFNVTRMPGEDSGPRWSPDGKKIVFQRNDPAVGSPNPGGNFEIYTINADGTGLRRLTNNDVFDAFPIWSPDGKKIAFSRGLGAAADLWVMDADTGANQQQLTTAPGFDGRCDWQRLGPGGQLCTIAGGGPIVGTDGPDVICGSAGDDAVDGRGGNDVIATYHGNDRVSGGPGNDTIDAGEGDDIVSGDQGADTLLGGPGNDLLIGDQADVVVSGGGQPGDRCYRGPQPVPCAANPG